MTEAAPIALPRARSLRLPLSRRQVASATAVAGAALIVLVLAQAWTKALPLSFYLLEAGLLGLIVAIGLITDLWSERTTLLLCAGLIVAPRVLYLVGTAARVMPGGDPYGSLGVLRSFLANGAPLALAPSAYVDQSAYSQWPAVHIVAAFLASASGIDALTAAIWLPVAFLGLILGSTLLIVGQFRDLFGRHASQWALFFVAIYPSVAPPLYKHQYFVIPFVYGLLFLIQRQLRGASSYETALTLLLIATVIVGHHFTVLVLFTFIGSAFAIRQVLPALRRRPGSAVGSARLLLLTCFTALGGLLWWSWSSTIVWPFVTSGLAAVYRAFRLGLLELWTLAGESTANYPSALRPWWAIPTLRLRDVVLLFSLLAGIVFLLSHRRYFSRRTLWPFACLVGMTGLMTIDELVVHVAPLREPDFTLPYLGLVAGLGLSWVLSLRWMWVRVLLAAGVTMSVLGSLTGLFADSFVMLHIYSNSVSFASAGEHPLDWPRVGGYLHGRRFLHLSDMLVTDDVYALSLAAPESWYDLRAAGFKDARTSNRSVVVGFRDLDTFHTYLAYGDKSQIDPSHAQVPRILDATFDRTYDDGSTRVWVGRGL